MSREIAELQAAVRAIALRVLGEDLSLSDVAQMAGPEPAARPYQDAQLSADVMAMEQRVNQVIGHLRQIEADIQSTMHALQSHTHDPIGFDALESRVARLEQMIRRAA